MPPKKANQIDPTKDSASEGDLPRQKCKRVLRWVKIRIGDKIQKRKMWVKKPTPYPIKGGRVHKVRPHNRMSMPAIGSTQRREENPPAGQPGQEDRYLMTTSQLGATLPEGNGLSPPPKKPNQIDPTKDSASEGDLPRQRCKKVLRWVKIRIGDKIRKRKMLVKKPTPYPIKGGRVPRVRPHNRVSMPAIGSTQRREENPPACQPGQEDRYLMTTSEVGATLPEGNGLSPPQPSTQRREATPPACQPGQDESCLMTTSQLGATMSEEREPMPTAVPTPYSIKGGRVSKIMPHSRLPMPQPSTQRREEIPPPCQPGQEDPFVMTTSQLGATMTQEPRPIPPLVKGVIVGLRIFQQYEHELGLATRGDGPTSSHITPNRLMQVLAQYQAQGLAEGSLPFVNPSQVSDQSRAPSGISSLEMQPGGTDRCSVLFKNKDIPAQTWSETSMEALAEYQAQGSSNSSLEGSLSSGSSFEGLLSGNPSLETLISDDSCAPGGFSWQPGSAGQMTNCTPCLFKLQQQARHVVIKPEPDEGQDYYNQCPTEHSFPFMNRNIHTQTEAQGSEHLPGQTLSELSFGAWMDINFDQAQKSETCPNKMDSQKPDEDKE